MIKDIESIYIHIPFCKTKCPYCDFASWANKEHLTERYFDSLISEVNTKCEAYNALSSLRGALATKQSHNVKQSGDCGACPEQSEGSPRNDVNKLSTIKTIFIGGGTPSLVAPEYYERLFNELRKYFEISKDCEITLELNPGTARDDYLSGYKELGINRISIGAQSFNEKILETLGRKHSVEDTVFAINKVKEKGFDNFNLDLIFTVPGMTCEIWIDSIYRALEFNPKHISSYSLIIEPNTPFENIYKNPKLLPEDDFSAKLYDELCEILKKAGFVHYEISNFAKPHYESRHNLTYWLAKEYFAFGLGAHRYLNRMRTSNTRELETYIVSPCIEKIIDYPIDYNFEKIMLSSRLNEGFDINLIEKVTTKSQNEIRRVLKDLSDEGFLELSRDKIHLTDKGFFVNNEILLKLL